MENKSIKDLTPTQISARLHEFAEKYDALGEEIKHMEAQLRYKRGLLAGYDEALKKFMGGE